jgi:hypothetical protein
MSKYLPYLLWENIANGTRFSNGTLFAILLKTRIFTEEIGRSKTFKKKKKKNNNKK